MVRKPGLPQLAGQAFKANQPVNGLTQITAGQNHVTEHLIGAGLHPLADFETQARIATGLQDHQKQSQHIHQWQQLSRLGEWRFAEPGLLQHHVPGQTVMRQ